MLIHPLNPEPAIWHGSPKGGDQRITQAIPAANIADEDQPSAKPSAAGICADSSLGLLRTTAAPRSVALGRGSGFSFN